MSLDTAIQHLLAAKRISGDSQSYRRDNPTESQKVLAYLRGGARPTSVSSEMGKGLLDLEDVRRASQPPPPPPPPPPVGDKFASPSGSDSNPGSFESPYRTLVKLQTSLTPGQTGSLRAGTYGSASTYHNLSASGTNGNQITVQGYPGETVIVKGQVDVTGNYVTLRQFHYDGSNSFLSDPPKCGTQALGMTTKGHDLIIEYLEIYQSTTKGSGILQSGDNNIFRFNIIHDIGYCWDFDHGIYVGDGNNIQIYGNWIYNNSHGWGVQLYPSCTNVDMHSNVIDNCGSGVVICDAVSGCDVYNNVVTDSVGLPIQTGGSIPGAGISGCGPSGGGNKFRDNDCFNNPGGVGSVAGVTITDNITSDPLFVDGANHNYLLQGGSPAAGYGLPTSTPGPAA